MAARISATAVDFALLATKVPIEQKPALAALQNKLNGHLRKVNSLPAVAPAIDFDAYRVKVTVPGMVDNFAAKYSALNIPYPGDQGLIAAIDAQGAEQKIAVADYCAKSEARIAELKIELARWEAMKPVEEMTREEALDAGLIGTVITGVFNPDVPAFWPYTETYDEWKVRLAEAEDDH